MEDEGLVDLRTEQLLPAICRSLCATGGMLVEAIKNVSRHGPEFVEALRLGLEMALLRLPKAIPDVRNVRAALQFDCNKLPFLGLDLLRNAHVGIGSQADHNGEPRVVHKCQVAAFDLGIVGETDDFSSVKKLSIAFCPTFTLPRPLNCGPRVRSCSSNIVRR